jgi:vacuolar-type H+-ATPase subunit E/Vma4
MGTEELKATVLEEAAVEAAALVDAATAAVAERMGKERQLLEELTALRIAEHRAEKSREVAARTAALRIELRNGILARKQEWLSSLFQEVQQKIQGDPEQYASFLEHAIEQVQGELPDSLDCRSRDRELVSDILERRGLGDRIRVNAVLPDTTPGLVAHYSEAELDLTLNEACARLRDTSALDVAHLLFGDDEQ